MRLLKAEEIRAEVKKKYPWYFGVVPHEREIAKAQYQADIKDFVEWLVKNNIANVPFRGIIISDKSLQSLKQLVE